MRTRTFAAGTVVLALAACSGGGGVEVATPTSTTEPLVETIEVTATTAAPTTAIIPSTTTSTSTTTTTTSSTTTTTSTTTSTTMPPPTGSGLVWESAVDPSRVNTTEPRPSGSSDGVTSELDMVILVASSARTELGTWCRDEAASEQDFNGGDFAEQCLLVQVRFDVAADFRTDQNSTDALVTGVSAVTSDGRQVDTIWGSSAFPATVDNIHAVMLPHGGAGSTIRWQTGSNLVGFTTFSYVVPELLPEVYFD